MYVSRFKHIIYAYQTDDLHIVTCIAYINILTYQYIRYSLEQRQHIYIEDILILLSILCFHVKFAFCKSIEFET